MCFYGNEMTHFYNIIKTKIPHACFFVKKFFTKNDTKILKTFKTKIPTCSAVVVTSDLPSTAIQLFPVCVVTDSVCNIMCITGDWINPVPTYLPPQRIWNEWTGAWKSIREVLEKGKITRNKAEHTVFKSAVITMEVSGSPRHVPGAGFRPFTPRWEASTIRRQREFSLETLDCWLSWWVY